MKTGLEICNSKYYLSESHISWAPSWASSPSSCPTSWWPDHQQTCPAPGTAPPTCSQLILTSHPRPSLQTPLESVYCPLLQLCSATTILSIIWTDRVHWHSIHYYNKYLRRSISVLFENFCIIASNYAFHATNQWHYHRTKILFWHENTQHWSLIETCLKFLTPGLNSIQNYLGRVLTRSSVFTVLNISGGGDWLILTWLL